LLLPAIGMLIAVGMARGISGILAIPKALKSFNAIALPIALSVSLIVLVVSVTDLGTIPAVAVVMPVLCLLRLAFLGREAVTAVIRRVGANIHRMSDELLLFMAAAAIGMAIQSAGIAEAVVNHFHFETLGPLAMIALVIALGPILALLGLHPIVAASIVTAFLAPLGPKIPDIVEVQLILFVWSCGAFLSFGSLSIGAAARLFSQSVATLVLSSNILFVGLQGLAIMVVLGALTLWLPG
jgi:hypothetical protein